MKSEFMVRVVYIVPCDAEPWKDAKRRAAEWLEDIQWFFSEEMCRLGYGPKTFEIARENNSELVFREVKSTLTKREFENNPANACKFTAQTYKLRSLNDIVVFIFESYSFPTGKKPIAASKGASRNLSGEAFISSLHLKLARREWIANENGYGGEIFDWIRPERMEEDTLSWNGRGKKLGDVSGADFGIMAHELGHAFGLHHDKNNDSNRKGNLMGKGCRGMRGYFRPDLTDDFCVLTKQDVAFLNNSNFFSLRNLKPKSIAFS